MLPRLSRDVPVAREHGSSDLSSCLLLWEASASLQASVPMKSALEGFRASGDSRLAVNPPASCAESGPFGKRKSGSFPPTWSLKMSSFFAAISQAGEAVVTLHTLAAAL